MSTIAAAVFDVVTALPDRACSMRDVIKALPDIDRDQVISAVHRLSDKGVLVARHHCFGFIVFHGARCSPADRWSRQATQERTIDAPA